jgi:hypothetical protein
MADKDFATYDGGNWFGMPSLSALRYAVEHSWPEGLQKIEENMREVHVPAVGCIKRRRVRRDFGDHVDIHRVYAGDLNRAWLATERRIQHGLGRDHVTILVANCGSASRSLSQMFWRGAAASALARMFESSGRRVQIVGFMYSKGTYRKAPRGYNAVSFVLKEYDAPLDLNRVAATTALAGFLRIWGFRAELSLPDEVCSTFGQEANVKAGYVKDAKKLPEKLRRFCGSEGTIVIDGVWSQKQAQSLLDKTAAEFAGKGVTA